MHPEEFGELVTAYKNRLFRLACWMLHDPAEAEDLVQDVFLKLWKMKSELNNYQSVEALIVAITRNLCLNKIKARRSMISDNVLERSASQTVLPDVQVEQKEKIAFTKALIERLPEQQRIVMQLKGVEGMEINEIAELLSETDNNIRVILSRARKSVRESWQKYYGNE
jgi:RNA polymerase sigma-70 factor (ECF subfamily)